MTDEIQKNTHNPLPLLIWDRLLDTVDMVLRQFTSGRWLLTIAAGVCLVHFAWVLPVDKMDKIIDLLKDIIIFYFVVNTVTTTNNKKENINVQENLAGNSQLLKKPSADQV